MKPYWKQLEEIVKDLDKIKASFENGLAAAAEKDMIKAHDTIVSNFYAGHDPSSYRRLGDASQDLYSTIADHNHGRNQYGGYAMARISSEDMGPHGRARKSRPDITKDNVFDLVWNEGIRGLPREGVTPLADTDDVWHNPYWSGRGPDWHNVFRTQVRGLRGSTRMGTPRAVMDDFVNRWGYLNGSKHADDIARTIRSSS